MTRPGAVQFVDSYVPVLEGVAGATCRGQTVHDVAMGCTGGKHRSVAMAQEISRRLADAGYENVATIHRDLGRE